MIESRPLPRFTAFWILALFALVLAYLGQKMAGLFPERWDFEVYLRAAERLRVGEIYYLLNEGSEHNKSPFSALILVPLSYLPRVATSIFSDVLSLGSPLAFAWLLRTQVAAGGKLGATYWIALPLALIACFNSWMSETLIGQNNLVLALLIYVAGTTPRAWLSPLLCVTAVLFKPTYLLFFPWIWFYQEDKKTWIRSALAFVLFLSISFGVVFGFEKLVTDHLFWMSFIDQATLKWMYGSTSPVSMVARFTGWGLVWVKTATLAGLLLSSWIVYSKKHSQLAAFLIISLVALGISPFSWRMNYVLLFPACLIAAYYWLSSGSRYRSLAFFWIAFQGATNWVYAPKILGDEGFRIYGTYALPFFAAAAFTLWVLSHPLKRIQS